MDYLKEMNLLISFPYNKIQSIPIQKLKEIMFNCQSKDKFNLQDVILKTDIGEKFQTTNCNYLEFIDSKLFNNFYARHKSMNYSRVFQKTNINKNYNYFEKYRRVKKKMVYHYTENNNCQDQYHIAQIREVIRTILFKVISQELIGNNRNKKKFLKTFYNFLKTAKTEPFCLSNLVKGISILSIPWIKATANQQTKYVLIAKFVKWLFQYFIVIIFFQFHITYIKEEKVFIFIRDWIKQKKEYLRKMNNKMALEPVYNNCNITRVYNKVFMIPKHTGLRLIIKAKYTKDEIREWRKVLSVLKYLYENYLKNKSNSFSRIFMETVKKNNDTKDKIFLVSADIFDAYGSIRPAKLFDIISILFQKLEDKLELQRYMLRKCEKFKVINTSKLLFGSLKINRVEIIEKCYILKKIKEYIYNTKVVIGNKVYNLCKGVPQGLILSATLCDIYYAYMRKKYFINFEKYGSICTYVDDSIYITKNLEQATLYWKQIKKGIPEYNCWFHKIKLMGNINIINSNDINHASVVNYLGWKINTHSLEIEPKYSSARYSTSFKSLSCLSLQQKLQNLSSLKLNKLVICGELNNKAKIFNNIQIIAKQQAKRCYALLNTLNVKTKLAVKIIHITNSKIIHKIEKLAEWDKFEKEENKTYLQYIIWKSFYDVFNKKKNSFSDLIKEFKKMLLRYSKATKLMKIILFQFNSKLK